MIRSKTSSDSRRSKTPEDIAPRKRGPKPRAIIEFPDPAAKDWVDPPCFADALRLHMSRHDDSCFMLRRAIIRPGETFDRKTLQAWASGAKTPQSARSLTMIERIERRYRLPPGSLKAKIPTSGRATKHELPAITPAERRRLAWHLPDDFETRSATERAEILEWIRTVIISGSTDYRRYQVNAIRTRYSLRFPTVAKAAKTTAARRVDREPSPSSAFDGSAPPLLAAEIADLVRFKSSTLTAIGEKRNGVWGEETVDQMNEHFGLMFGALTACPAGDVAGAGIPRESLSVAMLVFPAIWDWYLKWRENRRGFFTRWEMNMLAVGLSLTRRETGWLRQNPALADRLVPIPGFLSPDEIRLAQADWGAACEAMHRHGLNRSKEIKRVARVHRDPFEPILPILQADSPVGEYRRITTEILDRMPDPDRFPRSAAKAVRSFLMLRLGLHLGLRQKNLRQMLVCPRGQIPRSERLLETQKRGEIRWSSRDHGWEVLIPSVAFKNANSSFFGKKPFRLVLPDLDGLYRHIDGYLGTHRAILLGDAEDPGTFFVKTVKRSSSDASYDQSTFYEAWRLTIQRYGIHNPYTGRGAIKGLLPHGPHNVRDVLATHILKQTGSYEQASYAIQDTPEMVAEHYGRFLPQDKAALAAQILNRVWAA